VPLLWVIVRRYWLRQRALARMPRALGIEY
jgi:hypothetical protein